MIPLQFREQDLTAIDRKHKLKRLQGQISLVKRRKWHEIFDGSSAAVDSSLPQNPKRIQWIQPSLAQT